MAKQRVRCTVVEVGCDDATADSLLAHGGRRVLPWNDPFISELVAKYRLRAALDDSLQFLQSEASQYVDELKPGLGSLPPRSPRFHVPPSDDIAADASRWPD